MWIGSILAQTMRGYALDSGKLGTGFGGAATICVVPAIASGVQCVLLLLVYVEDSPKFLHSEGQTEASLKALNLLYAGEGSAVDEVKVLSEVKDDVSLMA